MSKKRNTMSLTSVSQKKTTESKLHPVLIKILRKDYFRLNPDVAMAGLDPVDHFRDFGSKEDRLISVLFDREYLKSLILDSEQDCHFSEVIFGRESSDILPARWLDLDYLRKFNDDFAESTPLEVLEGIMDGKITNIHPLFDVNFYLRQAENIGVCVEGSPLLHYLYSGWRAGLEPHPLFDSWFFQENSGPLGSECPWLHYVNAETHWSFSISPFVDERHLNHRLFGLGLTKPDHLSALSFAIQEGSTSADLLHPHLAKNIVDYIINGEDTRPFELTGAATVADLTKLVGELRLNKSIGFEGKPVVSVIIVNYRKPVLTILSVISALKALRDINHEIILVDNDGTAFENELYYRYFSGVPQVKIIPTTRNLYFGEGNNIAIDFASADVICFLNNDAFLDKRSAERLIHVLDSDPTVGAVGPVMFDANIRIGEAGGLISPFGEVLQLAKGRRLDKIMDEKLRSIGVKSADYVSAACLLVRTSILRKYGGFDYMFEPFYYEDTDLCLRLRKLGFGVAIDNEAVCLHLENTSTKEFLSDKFGSVVSKSQETFYSRWVLTPHISEAQWECGEVGHARKSGPTVGIYTPFHITLGGGENYILSLAAAAARSMNVTLITDDRTSITRFSFVLRDLGIGTFPFEITTRDEAQGKFFDLGIVMGNEITPPWIPSCGKLIYHCQFPFPLNHSTRHFFGKNKQIDSYLVNSEFTKNAIEGQLQRYRLQSRPVNIISPPVNRSKSDLLRLGKEKLIENASEIRFSTVGRYFSSGHCKRQDVIARVLNSASRSNAIYGEIYGGLSTSSSDQQFYKTVQSYQVEDKVIVQANVSRATIDNSFQKAHYYIHAAGLGVNYAVNPHQCEHFGITVAEAMANACVPIVYEIGGPADMVRASGVGYTFSTEAELQQLLAKLSAAGVKNENYVWQMRRAYEFANQMKRESFYDQAENLMKSTLGILVHNEAT